MLATLLPIRAKAWTALSRAACLLALALLVSLQSGQANAAAAPSPTPAPLNGYRHDVWLQRDGAPSRINSITQTPDGFLWIGSVEGLFRFDGLTFERVALTPASQAPLVVSQVKATSNGDVWVGLARDQGVRIVRNGKTIDPGMPHPSREVNDIALAPDGAIWIARGGRSRLTLARYANGHWHEFTHADGLPEQPVWNILFTQKGEMWVVCNDTVVRRAVAGHRFSGTGISVQPRASLTQAANGDIWLSDSHGTRMIRHNGKEPPRELRQSHPHPDPIGGTRVLFDRFGNLWETTWNSGVVRYAVQLDAARVPKASQISRDGYSAFMRVAVLNSRAGLSSDQTHALFEDREGNIWIGTELGLDIVHRSPLVVARTIPANPPSSYRMARARSGTIYVADASSLFAIAANDRPRRILRLDSPSQALCTAQGGGVWLFTEKTVRHVSATRTVNASPLPEGTRALGCAEDAAGRVWMPALDKGLYWMEGKRWQRLDTLAMRAAMPANAVLDASGKAVILFRGHHRAVSGAPFRSLGNESSKVGPIEGLFEGQGGLMISGSKGLQAIDKTASPVLDYARYPWAHSLNGLIQTPQGDTWAIGDVGIVKLRTKDLEAAFQHPGRAVPKRIFNYDDGLDSFVQKAPGAQVSAGGDGRIWFLTRGKVVFIDPARLSLNRAAPTVVIRTIEAGNPKADTQPRGRKRATLTMVDTTRSYHFAAGTRAITVSFTATALSNARRVRFRYRLGGSGAVWTDVGDAREITLGGLSPGNYTLQIIAANEDDVWNREGKTVTFQIARAYYQSWWFWILCTALAASLLYALHALRLRYLGALMRDRLAERNRERTRIARELHDTLLQGFQGLLMRFQSIADQISPGSHFHGALEAALERAEETLVEGRERVVGLRSMDDRDLPMEIEQLLDPGHVPPDIETTLTTSGAQRLVASEVIDDIVAIASEAIHNVVKHAQADELFVHIDFGRRRLSVLIRDNGIGFESHEVIEPDGSFKFGLVGMRERASRIGGRLVVTSAPGNGTQVLLTLHARIAYVQ